MSSQQDRPGEPGPDPDTGRRGGAGGGEDSPSTGVEGIAALGSADGVGQGDDVRRQTRVPGGRERQVKVRLTVAEHAELAGFASGVGMSLPRFLVSYARLAMLEPETLPGSNRAGHDGRRCAIERRQISAVFTRVSAGTRMLGGAANNLNQVVREMHVAKLAGNVDRLVDVIEEIDQLAVEVADAGRRLAAEARLGTDRLVEDGPADTSEWDGL